MLSREVCRRDREVKGTGGNIFESKTPIAARNGLQTERSFCQDDSSIRDLCTILVDDCSADGPGLSRIRSGIGLVGSERRRSRLRLGRARDGQEGKQRDGWCYVPEAVVSTPPELTVHFVARSSAVAGQCPRHEFIPLKFNFFHPHVDRPYPASERSIKTMNDERGRFELRP